MEKNDYLQLARHPVTLALAGVERSPFSALLSVQNSVIPSQFELKSA